MMMKFNGTDYMAPSAFATWFDTAEPGTAIVYARSSRLAAEAKWANELGRCRGSSSA
jgi:hypothetical protein